jgi:hypothetical protein
VLAELDGGHLTVTHQLNGIHMRAHHRFALQVGPTFEDVIKKCRLGHFQPSILFYEGEAVAEDDRTTTTATRVSPTVSQKSEPEPEPEPEPMDYTIAERPVWLPASAVLGLFVVVRWTSVAC